MNDHIISFRTFESAFAIKDETFSVYHGRYLFDVTEAYNLIRQNKIKYRIKEYSVEHLKKFQQSFLTQTISKKTRTLKMDYDRPIALIVQAYDPEIDTTEWFMIDGNHRVARAFKDGVKTCKVWEISDPSETAKFFHVDKTKKKSLFTEEE